MFLIICLAILLLLSVFLYGACVAARKADQEIEEIFQKKTEEQETSLDDLRTSHSEMFQSKHNVSQLS